MKIRRDIERALLGSVGGEARRRLHDRLRSDAGARALYDRGALVLRGLEGGREPADFEVDLVETWLREDGVIAEAVAPARSMKRGLWIASTVAFAAGLVVVMRPPSAPVETDEALVPKGAGQGSALAIEALCGDDDGDMHPATDGCALGDTLAFAYRVDAEWSGGETLVLFGVDGTGEARYYVPTPDTAAPTASVGSWQPLARSVRLAIHHRPGQLRVYGLLTDAPPVLESIDEAAALLSALPPATVGDAAWHERLPAAAAIANSCAHSHACASAELELWIHENHP
jgi:hypothetical protein